jgi:hypothetical protein
VVGERGINYANNVCTYEKNKKVKKRKRLQGEDCRHGPSGRALA